VDNLKSLRKNKTNKNLLDRFILTFECCTSAFGTSAIRSIGSFVFIVILFYVSINGFNSFSENSGKCKISVDSLLSLAVWTPKSTSSLNIVPRNLTSPLNSASLKVTILLNIARLKLLCQGVSFLGAWTK
jgi:hypothetical protein